MKILVTGAAGFIGFHLAQRLLREGHEVEGVDNLNDYYDVTLKLARLDHLRPLPGFRFHRLDVADTAAVDRLFASQRFDSVAHLAAQAGVRYSIENPHAYVRANLAGFVNIAEACAQQGVGHLVFASSSSVYGANRKAPFSTRDNVDHPVSLYAATKKSNELLAHSYSHTYGLPVTGLRFFTVYGPWGRPDMAYFKFAEAIEAGRPIPVYNHGDMSRDFTYIDDIVEGVVRVLDNPPRQSYSALHPDESLSQAVYRIYNIGNHQPVRLLDFISALERCLGKTAVKQYLPMQPGDVPCTYADTEDLERDTGFQPATTIEEGLSKFVEWYRSYFGYRRSVAC